MSSTVLNPTDDRGNEAMAIFWMEGSLAILVMSARFYSRFQLRSISADDWWMLITLVRDTVTRISDAIWSNLC